MCWCVCVGVSRNLPGLLCSGATRVRLHLTLAPKPSLTTSSLSSTRPSSSQQRHASHLWTPLPTAELQVPRPEKTAGGADHHLGADPHPQGAGGHRGVAQQLQLQPQCQHALPGPTAPEELSSVHEQWWCVAFSANPAGVAQSDSKCRQATATCEG